MGLGLKCNNDKVLQSGKSDQGELANYEPTFLMKKVKPAAFVSGIPNEFLKDRLLLWQNTDRRSNKNWKNEIGETHGTFFNLVFIDFFDNNYVIMFRKILKRNYWRIKKSSGLSDWNSRKIIGIFLVFSPGPGQIHKRFLDQYDCKILTN